MPDSSNMIVFEFGIADESVHVGVTRLTGADQGKKNAVPWAGPRPGSSARLRGAGKCPFDLISRGFSDPNSMYTARLIEPAFDPYLL